jgi:taurine dioxygenase
MEIRPLTGEFGCEILDVQVAQLSEAQFDEIYAAWLQYSVVVFRDQQLEIGEFATFGRRFAPLEDEPFLPYKSDEPGVYYFKGAGRGEKKLSTQNLTWHVDHSYQANPSLGAMLYGVNVPRSGGDTVFSSNYLAYDYLSEKMQGFLAQLEAEHDVLQYGVNSGHRTMATPEGLQALSKRREKFPPTRHPLICEHPETGRKMLYLNEAWTTAICDLQPTESAALLSMLKAHAVQPLFQCRVRWFNQSLLLWDNRAVQHRPTSDYVGERYMWRLALHSNWRPGEAVLAPADAAAGAS